MFNRTGIIVLTIIVSVLCIYNLSFTFISRNVQKDATEFATTNDGQIDLNKRQRYLDSIYQEPVFNLLGIKYTYKEVKEKELSLGLDLQGGMHVVLEVSPVEILKALAGKNASDPKFTLALDKAKELQRSRTGNYIDLFYEAYASTNPGGSLGSIFNNINTRERGLAPNATDSDIKKLIDKEVNESVTRAENIIRTRVDKFGVIQPNIQRLPGTGRIQLELPGVDNPKRVRNLLQGVAQLEFLEVYFYRELDPYMQKVNDYLVSIEKADKTTSADKTGKNAPSSLFGSDSTVKDTTTTQAKADTSNAAADTSQANISSFLKLQRGPLTYDIRDTAKINRILAMPKVKSLFPSQMRFFWQKSDEAKVKEGEPHLVQLIPVKKERAGKALTGESVIQAVVDSDPVEGVIVNMRMNESGAKKWRTMTKKASSEREYTDGPPRRIAIVLDDVVYSAPNVNSEIPNGQSVISGNFSLEDAKDLTTILEAGKLPAPVRIVEEVIVGPSLGKEAIAQGLNSMLVGLGIVILFMIFYYSKGGAVADIALAFNVLFILGIMANFNAVLTLPGIAGMVLTIGMAVDANVLIFERIREELRNGKPLLTAIDLGYDKAFSSIFDSNVTTIITGAILYWLGSGPVQGFAITLIIGLICSFFTAVYISKVIVLWLARNKDEKSISFATSMSVNLFRNFNFDFIGKRKIAYVISLSILVVGIISIVVQNGLNLGVDFKGGRSYVVEFHEPVIASDVKESLTDDFKDAGTEVKAYGSNSKMKITTSYLINDESSEADHTVETTLINALKEYKGDKVEIQSSAKVGATVADDIVWDSTKAIILALIGIFIYVLFRFRKWQFSLGGVTALLHDAVMVIAMFSILRLLGIPYEVDQVFIAAILTIVGFSINDTVIVFDRVREFTAENAKTDLKVVINRAINDTLSRTIITTMTVLVVVVILLVFGGETLRGFSVAMLIGVLFGTYSTLFIAIPMVLDVGRKKDNDQAAVASGNLKKASVQ